jgi:hypothetical protein
MPVKGSNNFLQKTANTASHLKKYPFPTELAIANGVFQGDVVIQIQKVEPSLDVSARLTERTYRLRKELKRFGVAVLSPFVLEARPPIDFPSSPVVLGVCQNPFQQFTVTLAGLNLSHQCVGIEAEVIQKMLIEEAIIVVFALFANGGRPPFVEHTG